MAPALWLCDAAVAAALRVRRERQFDIEQRPDRIPPTRERGPPSAPSSGSPRIAQVPQRVGQGIGQDRVIFNDEYAHERCPVNRIRMAGTGAPRRSRESSSFATRLAYGKSSFSNLRLAGPCPARAFDRTEGRISAARKIFLGTRFVNAQRPCIMPRSGARSSVG